MSNVPMIHGNKEPVRIHFIVEWAEHRNLQQVDIANEVGADKSLVSRWFSGTLPKPDYLVKLAALFGTDIPGLFRHPDDDWLARLFRDRTDAQKQQAIDMLKILFKSGKTGTEG